MESDSGIWFIQIDIRKCASTLYLELITRFPLVLGYIDKNKSRICSRGQKEALRTKIKPESKNL